MIILYAVLFGIILGYLFGGRLGNLGKSALRFSWLAFLSFAVQLIIFSDSVYIKLSYDIIIVLHLLSYIILMLFIIFNIKVFGIGIIGFGILLNVIVIFSNGGLMPTYIDNLKNTSMAENADILMQSGVINNSAQITSETILPWLGDIFYLPKWIPFSNVFSIGDIIIAVGLLAYFVHAMKLDRDIPHCREQKTATRE